MFQKQERTFFISATKVTNLKRTTTPIQHNSSYKINE